MSHEFEDQDKHLYREAFLKLKPICVSLLPIVQIKTVHVSQLLRLLKALREALLSISSSTLQKGQLASYAFYPLSQLLQHNALPVLNAHQSVLEECFLTIRVLVDTGGLARDTILQVWLVAILILGGPLESSLSSKGKAKEKPTWSEDASLAVSSALLAILKHAKATEMLKSSTPVPEGFFSPSSNGQTSINHVPNPVLAHTLTSLLDLAQSSKLSELRFTSLKCLDTLITDYMQIEQTTEDLVVQFLPGTVSALCKIVVGGKANVQAGGEKTNVLIAALSILRVVIERALGNEECAGVLAEQAKEERRFDRLEDFGSFASIPASTAKSAAPQTGKVLKTTSWLRATSQQVHLALESVVPILTSHPSARVREACVSMIASLLQICSKTLQPTTIHLLLEQLLLATEDEWPQVSSKATLHLTSPLQSSPQHLDTIAELLNSTLSNLSQHILSFGDDENKLSKTINLLNACASVVSSVSSRSHIQFKGVERWSWTLLRAIEFARLPGFDDQQETTARAWITQSSHLTEGKNDRLVLFPTLVMRRIPSATLQSKLSTAIQSLARAFATSEEQAALLVEHFLGIATGGFGPQLKASAWWMVSVLLQGLAEEQASSERGAKLAKTVVKAFIQAEGSEEENEDQDLGMMEESEALIPVERTRGSTAVASLLDDYAGGSGPNAAIENARRVRQSQQIVAICLSLRALAASSALLASSFRIELLATLYLILAHIGPSAHHLLREHAEVCLAHVAFHSGYASSQNLIFDNVDYILNSVSQRLTVARLDPRAPAVLVSVIHLVGSRIVPLIQDIVDDVFDGLDNYHGYHIFCSRLLAVLDSVMKALNQSNAPQERVKVEAINRPYPAPDCQSDLAEFCKWHQVQNGTSAEAEPDDDPFEGKASAEAFRHAAAAGRPEGTEEHDMDAANSKDDEKPAATRPQAICAAIISKALFFLSHSSAFLRARVLSVITSGVPVLGGNSRESDLLPLINKAWPIILNRLKERDPSVVLEAASLIEALSNYVGDFVCRRLLDDVWPIFTKLLEEQSQHDSKSAIAGRSPFTASHRLHKSILTTMRHVIVDIPLRDNIEWAFCVTFARFLADDLDTALQSAAIQLFEALKTINPEAVWLVLESVTASEGTELASIASLKMDNCRRNVDSLLSAE